MPMMIRISPMRLLFRSTTFSFSSPWSLLPLSRLCAYWLSVLDSNQRNNGVKVRCLTTWLTDKIIWYDYWFGADNGNRTRILGLGSQYTDHCTMPAYKWLGSLPACFNLRYDTKAWIHSKISATSNSSISIIVIILRADLWVLNKSGQKSKTKPTEKVTIR